MDKYQKIDLRLYQDASKQAELRTLLSDAKNTLCANSEPLLFVEPFKALAFEYLSHHALKEEHQHLLFSKNNGAFLEFYVKHWGLSSDWEKELFCVQYRPYLWSYLQRGALIDSQNEMLLFEKVGLSCFRRFDIKRYTLHCRDAEAQLFLPEYVGELALYIEGEHRFFPEFVEILAAEYPQLYAKYCRYCPPHG